MYFNLARPESHDQKTYLFTKVVSNTSTISGPWIQLLKKQLDRAELLPKENALPHSKEPVEPAGPANPGKILTTGSRHEQG